MENHDTIVERHAKNSDWALFRTRGVSSYFYIRKVGNRVSMGPMLHLADVSHNFFKCRSVACAIYDAFVSSNVTGE